ncbi:methionyl-tRNA formyltransferase [Patescibacteria group bacterium]|nr:methionyl-tRNA formyltransferase [Patescibacteria group bacterium]
MLRVVFYGTSRLSVQTLEALVKDTTLSVVGVVTQPDRPVGRKQVLTPPPIKEAALRFNLPVFQFEQVKSDEAYEQLKDLKADVAVVASFGQIISQRVLDLYPRDVLNVHPSLLPAYRGAIPMTAAIRDGLTQTGVTIMLMDALMDHGPILSQIIAPIEPTDTTETLSERLGQIGADLLVKTLHGYIDGTISPQEQDHTKATFVKLLSRTDGNIDWNQPAEVIERLIRAYTPWPGTSTDYKGKRLKVLRAHVVTEPQPDLLVMPCGNNTLLALDEVQPEGKTPMTGSAFLHGQQR